MFVTFYSFKGGVGRTMALVNTACILAARGRRVLMIDFDLEAPGLTFLALKDLAPATSSPKAGLVELVHDFLRDPQSSPLADSANKTGFHDRYVCPLRIPASLKRLDGGTLDLMPCDNIDETYSERLYRIDFKELYAEGVGQPLFKHLKHVITESDLYDYILIDSRTGFSDEGGICTRDLADHIFVVMGLNRQNVDGTVKFLHRLEASGWKEGRVLFVASPVPTGYEELRDARLAEAKQAIEQTRFEADFRLRIPYHPRLALDEEPFVYRWSDTDLFSAYERINDAVRELAGDTASAWLQMASQAIQKQEFDQALNYLNKARLDAPDLVVVFLREFTGAGMDDEGDYEARANAQPFFQLWLDVVGNSAEIRLRYSQILRACGECDGAYQQAEAALELAIRAQDLFRMASARSLLGEIARVRGQYDRALQECESALETFQQLNSVPYIAVNHLVLGVIYIDIGLLEQAMSHFQSAAALFASIGNVRHATLAQVHIADTHYALGNLLQAQQLYEQAVLQLERVGTRCYLATALLSLGKGYTSAGKLIQAHTVCSKALSIVEEIRSREHAAFARRAIGNIFVEQGDYAAAQQEYESARKIFQDTGDRVNAAAALGELGKLNAFVGDIEAGLAMIAQANGLFEQFGVAPILADGRLDLSKALIACGRLLQANNNLEVHWEYIQRCAYARVRFEAYVVRAKIKASLGDPQGAAADARVAVDFYQEQGVETAMAREARELAQLASK